MKQEGDLTLQLIINRKGYFYKAHFTKGKISQY